MSAYTPPVQDMAFVLKHIARMDEIAALPGFEDVDDDLVTAVLEEAAKLAANVWAPLNEAGDKNGAKLEGNAVKPTPGFKEAYQQYVEGGWNALTHNTDYGGQGLPWSLSMACNEMWQAANLALGLNPLLTQAGIEAIGKHGTDDQKNRYLAKLISGEWAGTMCLTEPQAGTDLSTIRTLARKDGDHYTLSGQKIYITWGDHDFTDNIIHMVLARIDGLPEGNKGLGLFIVPKYLVNDDGSLGARNDVYPVALEHKLGIHGSPTCVMQYGETEGATAYLVGTEGEGLKNMFTMMNNARISVGLQGVSLCDRSYQHALAYAKDRVQAAKIGDPSGDKVAIIEHADVRRMLLTMKAYTEAGRALSYYAGAQLDHLHKQEDRAAKQAAAARVDLLTPLVKGWCTDLAVEMTSLGIQIHGGMGFIEETGAAQFYRDARILPIYEGTNGIQAIDLLFRKLRRDDGAEVKAYISEMRADAKALEQDVLKNNLLTALDGLETTSDWLLANDQTSEQKEGAIDQLAAAAPLYLRQFAIVAAGSLMARQVMAAEAELKQEPSDFLTNKIITARYFIEALLPQADGLIKPITGGQSVLSQISSDQF